MRDLFDSHGNVLDYDTFCNKFPMVTWLDFTRMVTAVPRMRRILLLDMEDDEDDDIPLYNCLLEKEKNSRIVYDRLINDDNNLITYTHRWFLQGYDFEMNKYRFMFKCIESIMSIVKYHDFQYRLLLGKLVTNEDLCNWKKITNNHCNFCQ